MTARNHPDGSRLMGRILAEPAGVGFALLLSLSFIIISADLNGAK